MNKSLRMQQTLIDALEGLIESESAEQTDEGIKHAKSVIERAKRETSNNALDGLLKACENAIFGFRGYANERMMAHLALENIERLKSAIKKAEDN